MSDSRVEAQPLSGQLSHGAGQLELRDTAYSPQPELWQLLPSYNRTMWQKNPWEKKIQLRPIWRKDFVKIILKTKRDFLFFFFFFCLRSSNEKEYQAELSLQRLLQDHMSLQKCHFNWCKCEGVRTPGIKFLLKYTCFLGEKMSSWPRECKAFWKTLLSLIWRVSDATGLSEPPPCCRLAWDHTWPCWPRGRGWGVEGGGGGHLS